MSGVIMESLHKYNTFIFDCDGVILNSNKVKTQAFYNAALNYGEHAAQELVDYHVNHGGISRYRKFEYFLQTIVGSTSETGALNALLSTYATEVRARLLTCGTAPGLDKLRSATSQARWMVVSGGDQSELNEIFSHRNMHTFFDGGIYGSPDTKETILEREITSGNIKFPALFLGDSLYDHEAASRAGIDFIFVSDWTEWSDWKEYISTHSLPEIKQLLDLIPKT